MKLPIVAYGHPTLRKVAVEIDKDYEDITQLIEDMFETMYHSSGVGLAAPQINRSIKLFVIDADPFTPDYPDAQGFKKVFINPEILETSGDDIPFTEGCLSLPNIYEEVVRKDRIRIRYYDENFEIHEEEYDGIRSRVIQHEYDHLLGHVHVDRINPMRKLLLNGKLRDISEGKCKADYRMLFPRKKRK